MCKSNPTANENPARNPIRVAAISELTRDLEWMGREGVEYNDHATRAFFVRVAFTHSIGVISIDEVRAWFNELARVSKRVDGVFPSCEPCRCEDCGATYPNAMMREIVAPGDGGGVSVCDACHAAAGDPRSRVNEFVEEGWDGCGDFEDTPPFQRDLPVELD